MALSIETLEAQLNDFDAARRRAALQGLLAAVAQGDIPPLPATGTHVNIHAHTFFSYNGYGYSPTDYAWRARKAGLLVAGIVDFDVLDAVEEFLDASQRLGLRGCAGMETRVFVEEFATREINSPGEPGIAYVVGVGFVPGAGAGNPLLTELLRIAKERTRAIAARVNPYLAPAEVDFEKDVVSLTPKGNATERHLCMAYDQKARTVLADPDARAAFWAEKLGQPVDKIRAMLDDAPGLQALIRAKTMKAGGIGYVQASGRDFPALSRFNAFTLDCGAIPTYAWLDGTTQGEKDIEELLDVMVAQGAAGITVIPERNWNFKDPAVKQAKLDNLYQFAKLAQTRALPLFAGTEMNAYGQRFVDDFETPELKPLLPLFQQGALLLYAHTLLQEKAGMGYLSPWAVGSFATTAEKNRFYAAIGRRLEPSVAAHISLSDTMTPAEIAKAYNCPLD